MQTAAQPALIVEKSRPRMNANEAKRQSDAKRAIGASYLLLNFVPAQDNACFHTHSRPHTATFYTHAKGARRLLAFDIRAYWRSFEDLNRP
ncbi:hypothetical protein T5B8_04373 [Salinisphaera sp. T5B8]